VGLVGVGAAPALADSGCQAAGDTGLTAKIVAASGAHLSGLDVDATGCDIGVYIGPGSSGTELRHSTITGANDHGVFVQDARDIVVADNRVSGNGVAVHHDIAEDKALQLSGTSDSTVRGNTVVDNVGDGGIGVADDGPAGPAAPPDAAHGLFPARGNVVEGNTVADDLFGCGIVVAAYNPGAGAWDNSVVGNSVSGVVGRPAVGGIVIAADPPNTSLGGNKVVHNTIKDALIPGIIVHSNAPGDSVTNTTVTANTLTGDGWAMSDGPHARTGIIVGALAAPDGTALATLSGTTVSANRIASDEDIGVCLSPTATPSTVGGLPHDHAATPVETSPDCMQAG
jgi:hypothetical protein